MLTCCFAAVPSSAQNTLTVADGTVTNGFVPIYGYYVDEYVKSQTIYPASMLAGMSGQNITSITFYMQLLPDDEWGVDFRVMLKEVPNDVFPTEAFVPTSLNDVVYSGPTSIEGEYITIDLDYPFTYTGGNLLLEISSVNTGEYASCSFFGVEANYASMQGYSSMSVSAITPSAQNFIPKTTFEYGVVSLCPKAQNLSADNVTATSATISWTGSNEATSYVVQYMPADSYDWDQDAIQLTTVNTSINITNLTTATPYQVRVKVICSDSTETAWSNAFVFIPGAYLMPVTGNTTMTTCNLMIYDDGGLSSNYSSDCNSVLVLIPDDMDAKIMLTGTCNTESGYDHLVIYDGIGESGTELADLSGTQDVSIISNSGPLTIHFTSDGSVTYPGFALWAQCVQCYPPTDVTVSSTSLGGATLTWNGDAGEYAIYLSGAMSGYYTTTGNTFTLTGLQPSSLYMVQIRSLCGSDSSILTAPVSFSTSCAPITVTAENPWVEDFESYIGEGGIPYVCWGTPQTFISSNGTYPLVFCGNGAACHSGVNSGEFKGSSNVLVLPEFNNNIANLRLSFWATSSMPSGTLEVGYVTDPLDAATFVSIANAGIPAPRGTAGAANGNYMGPFDFNGVSATGTRIALRYTNTSSLTAAWNVDDFTVELSPNCPSPVKTSVTASNIDGHSATISWVDNDNTHTAWTVFYRESDAASTAPWMTQAATTDHVSISGLAPETEYDVYVVTNCGTPSANPDATLTITFSTTISCPAPTGLTLTEVSTDQATVSWTSTASSFYVEYGPAGFTPGTGISTSVTGNTFSISNLSPFTEYTVIVVADCGSGDGVSSPVSMNFTTTQHAASLPYTSDFTSPNDTWILNNGICSNFWTIGTVNNTPAMFVTHDSVTAAYDVSSYSVVTAEKLFTVGEHASVNISFDANVGGEGNYDYLKVFFAPATESYPAATTAPEYAQSSYSTYALNFQSYLSQTATSANPYKFNLTQNDSIHMEFEMPNPNANPTPGSTAKLVFVWKNDHSVGTQPSAIISNVTVSVTGCPSPVALTDSNITNTSADIHWVPGDEETVWQVEYGLQGFTHGQGTLVTVNGTPALTLTNLTAATDYDVYVRAMCSAADSSLWTGPLNFATGCDIVTTYPYIENFDSYMAGSTARPHCWTFPVVFSLGAPYITSYYSTSSPNCLFFQSAITDHTTAVTPQFDADINTLRVRFMLKAENTNLSGTFEVGVMSDPHDISTFESVEIIHPENTSWNEHIVDLSGVTMTGPNRYIAFRQNSNSDNWYYWLDDVMVTPIPTCVEPGNIHALSTTSSSITLAWAVYGNENNWDIEYGPAGFTHGNGTLVNATTNPFTIDSLTLGIEYDFYVRTVCSADDQSIWAGPYTAMPGAYLLPTTGEYTVTACELTIFDDGGLNGNYSNSCNSTLTILPSDPTNRVSIQGMLTTESCCDYLRVYDGVGTGGTMLGEYKGTEIIIPELISSNGPLTIRFCSDYSVSASGFELTVSCYSNSCPEPAVIVATNITTNSANLTWMPSGNESAWVLEYKEYYDTVWTSIPLTTTSYQLTGLNTLTAYDVRVKASCASGDESMFTYATFNTNSCDVADQCPYTFNLFDSYGDGWDGATLNVLQNGVVVASLTVPNGFSSTETVMLCDDMFTALVWVGGNFDSECGFAVRDPYNNEIFNTLTTPSGTVFTFTSDCSDSTPVITDPTVATTAATDIDQTHATLNGTINNPDSVAITAKGFEWKATMGGTYAPVTVTGDSLTYGLTGLTANTEYTFKAFIIYNDTTVYGEEMTFTTLPEDIPEPCDAPNGLHTITTGGDFISIAWNDNPSVEVWNIQHRVLNGTWASATSSTNSHTITGLAPETSYEIRVQGDCGDGNVSDWSATITATTTVGIENWLMNSISLYPNPAKEVVHVQCSMNNVQIESIEVFDVYGKLLQTVSATPETTTINVSGLAAGMYFVRVTTEQGVVTKSFVKK